MHATSRQGIFAVEGNIPSPSDGRLFYIVSGDYALITVSQVVPLVLVFTDYVYVLNTVCQVVLLSWCLLTTQV